MRFFRVLLAQQDAVLGTAITFVLASTFTTAMNPPKTQFTKTDGTRLLRVAGTISTDLDNTEERGVLSAIKEWTKVKYSAIKDWVKVDDWVNAVKSDGYVKEKLDLENLMGAALTSHPNYKILQKFLYKREGRELDDWLDRGVTMHGAWMDLKLNTVNPKLVAKTDAYRKFLRYVKRCDDKVYIFKFGMSKLPAEIGGSPAEIFAKVKVWSATDRPRLYVKELLGVSGLSKSELMLNPYYMEFLRVTGKEL